MRVIASPLAHATPRCPTTTRASSRRPSTARALERRVQPLERACASSRQQRARVLANSTPNERASSAERVKTERDYDWDAFDVFASYGALAVTLGVLPGALEHAQLGYVPYFCALAATSIYIGAHRGLTRDFRETISFESSLAAPLALSASLLAVYVALELHVDLSAVVSAYFFVLGAIAVAGNSAEILSACGSWWKTGLIKVPVPDGWASDRETGEVLKGAELDVTPAQMCGGVVGLALAAADLQAGHQNFTLNNVIACCIVTDFLSVIGFGSFKSCATALCGLLAYDAFWVFKSEDVIGKNVMLTVATNQSFNGPFKLLFPRFEDVLNPLPLDSYPFSLLGLGDVAIPGLLCALMLRYDASRAVDLRGRANAAASAFMNIFESEGAEVASMPNRYDGDSKGEYESDGFRSGIGKRAGDAAFFAYDEVGDIGDDSISVPSSLSGRAFFSASLSAYLIGLIVAVAANILTGEGQPALVYLVPVVLGVVAYTALSRGESDRVFEFVDEKRESLL